MDKRLLLFLLFPLLMSYATATDVTECQTINLTGYYVLTQNVDSNSTCFNIESGGVWLNCDDYNITFNITGVYVNASSNVTVENCNIIQNSTVQGYGMKVDNAGNFTLKNSFISVYGNESKAVEMLSVNDTEISYSEFNISVSCWYCYGIYAGSSGNGVNMSYNTINYDGYYNSSSNMPSGLWVAEINNSYIIDNDVNVNGDYVLGVYVASGSVRYNTTINYNVINTFSYRNTGLKTYRITGFSVKDNYVHCYGNTNNGIYVQNSNNGNVSYNDVTATGSSSNGIILLQSESLTTCNDNWVGYNTLNASECFSEPIVVNGYTYWDGVYNSNTLVKNTIVDDTFGIEGCYYSLDLSGHNNNTGIVDMIVAEYFIGGTIYGFLPTTLSIENTTFGKVNFTTPIDADGWGRRLVGTFDSDIVFGNNSVFVNSTGQPAFNVEANVSLYGLSQFGFVEPLILKDGLPCEDCVNHTGLSADTVVFSVTGFSNYSIGEGYVPPVAEMFGFDVVGSTETFVGVLFLMIPVLAVLSIVFVFRDEFSKILKFPKL